MSYGKIRHSIQVSNVSTIPGSYFAEDGGLFGFDPETMAPNQAQLDTIQFATDEFMGVVSELFGVGNMFSPEVRNAPPRLTQVPEDLDLHQLHQDHLRPGNMVMIFTFATQTGGKLKLLAICASVI